MNRLVGGSKAVGGAAAANKKSTGAGKRKAEVSPRKMEPTQKKRSALGDLTNAVKKKGGFVTNKEKEKTKEKISVKEDIEPPKVTTRSQSKSVGLEETVVTKAESKQTTKHLVQNQSKKIERVVAVLKEVEKVQQVSKLPVRSTRSSRSQTRESTSKNEVVSKDDKISDPVGVSRMTTRSSLSRPQPSSSSATDSLNSSKDEDSSLLYTTAVSSPEVGMISHQDVEAQNRKNEQLSEQMKLKLPDGVVDFDNETGNDPFQVGLYAEDIFAYYKRREGRFHIKKYLDKQTELNRNMRCILIDWMVEVQESFELNHETMYLGVKLVDLFLSKVQVKREQLQLVGTTALYISAKYDERSPPVIDDFCYICDDAYPQKEVIKMETKILRTLNFDVGVPLSYRFLRRYSRCAKLDMETLTLARYILEMSLMEYDFIDSKDSMLASSALLLALVMKGVKDPWSKTLEYYSGYSKEDIFDFTHRLHTYLIEVPAHLKTIRSKYSHKVFYEVAKVPIPDELTL